MPTYKISGAIKTNLSTSALSVSLFFLQALGFRHFSLLGWSDGGITALIAAALNPALIRKLVVWGANAYVSEQDVKIYNGERELS